MDYDDLILDDDCSQNTNYSLEHASIEQIGASDVTQNVANCKSSKTPKVAITSSFKTSRKTPYLLLALKSVEQSGYSQNINAPTSSKKCKP